MPRFFARLFGMLLLAAACAAAQAHLLNDYAHTSWNGQRGAPADVLQFAQTPDGWLWVSSPNGLYRFDGVDFQRMDTVYGHPLHAVSTVGLLSTRDGRLWVGDRFGGISVFAPGGARVFTEADGVLRGTVMTMSEGPDGSVWAATSGGLAYLAPGAARFRRVGAAEGLPETPSYQVLFGRDGRQWVALDGGIHYRDPGETRFRRAWPRIDLIAMAEAPDGTLWGSDGVNKHYRVLAAAPPGNPAPRAELGGNGALFDRDGNMWILKIDALERRAPPYVGAGVKPLQLTRSNGMSGPLPQTVFQDREGNLWVGTSAGLDRLRRTRLSALPGGSAFDRPGLIADPRGGIIVGDWRRPLRRYDAAGPKEVVAHMRLACAWNAPDGSLWLADHLARVRRGPSGEMTRFPHPAGFTGHDLQAMTIDGSGRMWASVSRKGLFLIDGQAWRKHGGLPGLPDELAMALATDRQGRVWAGYLRNRIAMIDGARVQVFGAADGLRLGSVLSLLVDGARLWAGGQQGLAWYDGQRWRQVTPAGGTSLRGISGMVRTANGDLWLHGADGITRIGAPDLERLLRTPSMALPYERFDALDGLVGSAEQTRPLPSMAQSRDGRLWFATGSEVASLDPANIVRNRLPPPVQVLALRADGTLYPASGEVQLPPGSRNLQIAYTALSLTIPERARFRYRLDGVDEDWQEAGTRREAFYTNLRPGDYRFQVVAANEDGVWNTRGATLTLRIAPRFVDTGWFAGLLALLAAALLGALYRLRVRRITARMQDLMQERLAERERIARGLHDTLLQSVQSLIMFFDFQSRKLPIGAQERRKIEQTLDLADALMTEGRDYILDLRAASAPGELGRTLSEYGGVLLGERFSAAIHGAPRILAPRVRDEVHAIAREAIFNAARHARAGRVELIMNYRPDALALLVRDDGCGMTPDLSAGHGRPGHYGMAGMRERAEGIGAVCTVFSAPDKGTSVHVEIAAELAYPEHRSASLLARLRQRLRPRAKAA